MINGGMDVESVKEGETEVSGWNKDEVLEAYFRIIPQLIILKIFS